MQSREILIARGNELDKLRKLREDVDPASGISLMIRRGPLKQDEDGNHRNQWIELEFGGDLEDLIDLLIERQIGTFKYWKRAVATDIADAQNALTAAEKVSVDMPDRKV